MAALCGIEGCEKPLCARGWCQMHYRRWKTHGDTSVVLPRRGSLKPRRVDVEPCEIDGCVRVMKARGWCAAHYTRWLRTGSPTTRFQGQVVDGKRICSLCRVDKDIALFSPNNSWCKRCTADRVNERRPPRPPATGSPKACDCCGATFMANGRRSRYCTPECSDAHKNKANWRHVQKRRTRLRGNDYEPFDRLEIFERDHWICGLCDEAIDPALACPDPGSVSLDHIVPVSLGGPHVRDNVQAAHLGCNVLKGNRVLDGVA